MQDVDQSIVEKVRKILAKAESTNSREEAETFFAKAQELMTKHMIDEAMLAAAGGRDQDVITELRVNYGSTYHQAWLIGYTLLGDALGFQQLIGHRGKNGYGYWYGWKSELDMAQLLIASLEIQVARATNAFAQEYTSPAGVSGAAAVREDRFKARRSFIEGFLREVSQRLRIQRLATLAEESKKRGEVDGSLLPVLVDRNQLLAAFFESVPKGRATKLRSSATNATGYGAGKRAGQRADIGSPKVGGSRGALNA